MAIKAVCPACQASFNVRDELRGKKIRCSKCKGVFLIGGRAGNAVERSNPPAVKPPRRPVGDAVKPRPPKQSGVPTGPSPEDAEHEEVPAQPAKRSGRAGLVLGIVGGAVLLLLLFCGGAVFAVYHFVFVAAQTVKDNLQNVQTNLNNPDSQAPATPVTAEKLAKDYQNDKAAWKKTYEGKPFIVEGEVASVLKHVSGEPTVLLKGLSGKVGKDYVYVPVQCFFVADAQAKASQLKTGDKIKVKGRCLDSLYPCVMNCLIVTQDAPK